VRKIRFIILGAVFLYCSACTFTAQSVKITPEVKATSTVSAAGKTVDLSVADERPSKVIGQRGVSAVGADMTAEGDLEKTVTTAIVSGLTLHAFAVGAHEGKAASKLHVEIRNLSSKNIMGFWSGTLRDEFGLKAVCKSGAGGEYQKMYNGVFEKNIQVVPTGDANNEYISKAVSDAVNQLVNDDALLKCLVE